MIPNHWLSIAHHDSHTHTPGFADNIMIHNHWLSVAHHDSHTPDSA
ncbi:hypothetical protein CRYPD_52 [uncultured Candidatus Thioglobus sp.]|nr:hypothetical protein CRYPD_52 [uncultured Candidatus Thioglobus sp.]